MSNLVGHSRHCALKSHNRQKVLENLLCYSHSGSMLACKLDEAVVGRKVDSERTLTSLSPSLCTQLEQEVNNTLFSISDGTTFVFHCTHFDSLRNCAYTSSCISSFIILCVD